MPKIYSRHDQANNPRTIGPGRDPANYEHEPNNEYNAVNVLQRPFVHRMPPCRVAPTAISFGSSRKTIASLQNPSNTGISCGRVRSDGPARRLLCKRRDGSGRQLHAELARLK